jgi:hypothetical protein
MSAYGPKPTFHYVAIDVAFGGKADMSLWLNMSAFDPKRTCRDACLTELCAAKTLEMVLGIRDGRSRVD